MLYRASYRELLRHPLRTGFGVLGVAVATAMLVDMLMLGSGLEESFGELLRERGYELRVFPRGTLPFDTEATIAGAGSLRDSLAAAGPVAGVAPVLAANLLVRSPDSGSGRSDRARGSVRGSGVEGAGGTPRPTRGQAEEIRVFALGVDPEEQGLYRVLEGRGPSAEEEVILDRRTAGELGSGIGDTLRLAAPRVLGGAGAASRSFRVVGIGEFLYASRDERPLGLRMETLATLTGRRDEVSLFMLRLRPGTDPVEVARGLSGRFPRVGVASVAELVERAEDRLAYFRQLAYILGTVSILVTGLLVGTLMAVSVSERYGIIAALRAVGVSRRSIVTSLALESLLLCALAGVVGLALGSVTGRYLETILSDFPGIPQAISFFVLRPRHLAVGYATLLLAGVLAGALPGWRAANLEIATTLHREEP